MNDRIDLKNYLAWLQAESLPGLWSKGVALARTVKPELISQSATELKFKLKTGERMLAYEITLWPTVESDDGDAFCNCESKVSPCHHVIATAQAYQAGRATLAGSATGTKLAYSFANSDSRSLREILIREIVWSTTDGTEKRERVSTSLVGIMGGIQSGRLEIPMPTISQTDLKIDDLLNRNSPDGSPADLKPAEIISMLREAEVEIPTPLLSRWQEEIENEQKMAAKQRFKSGPEEYEADPVLDFKIHRLRSEGSANENSGKLSVTPYLNYGPIPENSVLKRNQQMEQAIAKKLRQDFQLALNQPVQLDPKDVHLLSPLFSNTDFVKRSPETFRAIEGYLTDTLGELKNIPTSVYESHRDEILHLLDLKAANKLNGAGKILLRSLTSQQTSPQNSADLLEKNILNLQTGESLPRELKLSRTLWEQLRDYQKQGVKWLWGHHQNQGGCILADDMGLGKTLQTICVLQKRSLVIVPSSLISNWQQELTRFRPELSVNIYAGSNRKWNSESDVTLTTYGVLRAEIGLPSEVSQPNNIETSTRRAAGACASFLNETWSCVVLDEAHFIRNTDTLAAIAAQQLIANFKIALTGTPIQNKARDLFSLFQFITPGLFQNENSLKKDLISPFILRRTKTEVLTELPPKTYMVHDVELDDDERKMYEATFAAAKANFLSNKTETSTGAARKPFTIFETLLRSRQVCDHRSLVGAVSNTSNSTFSTLSSSKLKLLRDLVAELTEAGHSVLVYSQWTKFLDLIEPELKKIELDYFRLDGSTQNRGDVIESFQKSQKAAVFLLSLHAGGVGLNLTQADHVIFCDPWWNPFVEIQAEDRAYRMGQEKPVTIHRLICTRTIEEKLLLIQNEKKKLGADLLTEGADGDANGAIALNERDLKILLE